MALIKERSIYIRNSAGEWWVGSGHWSPDFDARALHFSEPRYAWLDVGHFAQAGTELVEEREEGCWYVVDHWDGC